MPNSTAQPLEQRPMLGIYRPEADPEPFKAAIVVTTPGTLTISLYTPDQWQATPAVTGHAYALPSGQVLVVS
jgi:hypothetical protein